MLKQKEWPCIIVFPQKPGSESEWEDHEALVLGTLDAARKEWNIEPARIALTGLSQGGHGTWVIGSRITTTAVSVGSLTSEPTSGTSVGTR